MPCRVSSQMAGKVQLEIRPKYQPHLPKPGQSNVDLAYIRLYDSRPRKVTQKIAKGERSTLPGRASLKFGEERKKPVVIDEFNDSPPALRQEGKSTHRWRKAVTIGCSAPSYFQRHRLRCR